MKQKKIQFLACLRENSREKLTSISKKTGVPISTLFDFLKELQQTHIKKSTILLNFEEFDYHTQAHVLLKVAQEDLESIRKHLSCHPNVNSVYKINSGWNFMIETVHKNIRELDRFLDNLHQKFIVEKKEIHYLIEEIKKEGFDLNSENFPKN